MYSFCGFAEYLMHLKRVQDLYLKMHFLSIIIHHIKTRAFPCVNTVYLCWRLAPGAYI